MSKLKELQTEINGKHDQVKSIFDKADEEKRPETKEEIAEVKKINKEIETLELKATDLREGEELRASAAKQREYSLKRSRLMFPGDGEKKDKGDGPPNPSREYQEARKSLGLQVVSNEQYQAWLKGIAPNGRVSDGVGIQSPRVEVRSLITGGSDTSAGALVHTDYQPTINAAPFKPLTLRDLISNGETGSDTVEYVRINGYINNAAAVAEATATSDGSGAKPESGMDMIVIREMVRTIAHWIPATNRALADASQIKTLIDTFLLFGLADRLEALMLLGDGQGENFLGILNTPGIQVQAYSDTKNNGTGLLETTRKARTKCKTPGRVNPSAYLLHPLDWEDFDLLQDGEFRYFFGGPSILGNPRLWGLPVVENENLPEGRGLTGDFRYAMLWDRMQAIITMSNSHADFFIRNLVAILAELRAAFGVLYPKAFVDIDLTP